MDIDSKLKWFIITGDAIIKDADIKQKLIWDVQHVKNPQFPFRVHITCGKQDMGFAMEAKITLREFERLFEQKIKDVKKNQISTSLFGL